MKKLTVKQKRECVRTAKELGYLDIDFDLEEDIYNAQTENDLVRLLEFGRREREQFERNPKRYFKLSSAPAYEAIVPKRVVRPLKQFCERRGIIIVADNNEESKIIVYGVSSDIATVKKYLNKKGVVA